MILEQISMQTLDYPTYGQRVLSPKECYSLLKMNGQEAFDYLENLNRIENENGTTCEILLRVEFSSDPIGTINKCPAMGANKVLSIVLGDLRGSVMAHVNRYILATLTGWYDKPTHKIIPFVSECVSE